MGKSKLKLETIEKEKDRILMFKKRKIAVIKKMQELTTLCDVNGCLILYGGPTDQSKPEIWPPNPDLVNRIIASYNDDGRSCCSRTTSCLADFFQEKTKQIEEEIRNLRDKKRAAKYPNPTDFLNALTETQLREFAAALGNKSNRIKSKIQLLRRSKELMHLGSGSGGTYNNNFINIPNNASSSINNIPDDDHVVMPTAAPPFVFQDYSSFGILLDDDSHHQQQVFMYQQQPAPSHVIQDPTSFGVLHHHHHHSQQQQLMNHYVVLGN